MNNNKLLALAFALLLPLNHALRAEEVTVGPSFSVKRSESGVNAEKSVEAASQGATVEATPSSQPSMRDHWKAREAQYQSLKKRAEEAGVMLPERPPWQSDAERMLRPSMEERMAHRKQMMSMSQEERDAYRQQRHQEMRARAKEMGSEMFETTPWSARQQALDEEWAEHQKVIEGMSDEERAACHAMHRRHMAMMYGGGVGSGCGMGYQDCGVYQGEYAPRMVPGYGPYGPGYGPGYGPAPIPPYGTQNFWDPTQ